MASHCEYKGEAENERTRPNLQGSQVAKKTVEGDQKMTLTSDALLRIENHLETLLAADTEEAASGQDFPESFD